MKFLKESSLRRKTAEWAKILSISDSDTGLALSAPALLVLDMQNEFLNESGQMPVWGGAAVIPRVSALIRTFRSVGLPVVFSRHLCIEPFKHKDSLKVMGGIVEPAKFLCNGTSGARLHPGLPIADEDIQITKYRYSAFYDTALDTLLRVNRVADVIITGVATNICCQATAQDAFFRGYHVVFTIDGTGGVDEDSHLAALKTIQLAYGRVALVGQVSDAVKRLAGNKG
ncbi:MAG: isochorismatase family cysteine hydrolase [Elusimicrobiota bacterium]|nr:isochorismatase family cysteine hydrolase [Elusimicrobiota bacterium]